VGQEVDLGDRCVVKPNAPDAHVRRYFLYDFKIGRPSVEGLQASGQGLNAGLGLQPDQGFSKDMIELLAGKQYREYQYQQQG
jgi:hypothetical protein